MLWEFWKSDEELFPSEIVDHKAGLNKMPHAIIFVFDGSTDEVPATEEDARFYKQSIDMAIKRGYSKPFVIITKIDMVESRLRKELSSTDFDEKRKEFVVAEKIDSIITGLSEKLGLPREQIDFLENYTHDNFERNLKIEYYLLKTFKKVSDEGLRYVNAQTKKGYCDIF